MRPSGPNTHMVRAMPGYYCGLCQILPFCRIHHLISSDWLRWLLRAYWLALHGSMAEFDNFQNSAPGLIWECMRDCHSSIIR